MTANRDLIQALRRFLDDAIAARDRYRENDSVMRLLPGATEFARVLGAMPSTAAADAIALDLAGANGYLLREARQGIERRSGGRPLTARALAETGVAGLVLSGDDFDVTQAAAELAGYLAGPKVPVWDYAIIDASVVLSAPVPVGGGWELVTPSADELAALVGIPLGARHVDRHTFRLDLYGGLAMLRRIDPDGEAHEGLIYLGVRPAHVLWQPLLALSLFQNPVVRLWAQYDVEPGRRVELLFDRVYTEPWTPDGETEIEVVRHGDYGVDSRNERHLRQFLAQLAPLLARALLQPAKPTNATKERAARLRRVAEHFLTASEDAHGEGEVLSEDNADAVLHYVIALEAVLAGSESDKSELTRRVTQRAAVLAGRDGSDRRAVAAVVRAAYIARSAYAHGSEPEQVDLPALRRVVRDCILARLILGDTAPSGPALGALADDALLDRALLAKHVRAPIETFWAEVHGS